MSFVVPVVAGSWEGSGSPREVVCFRILKSLCGEFPGIPVVRTLCFHCSGPRFNPWSGN